MANWLEKYRGFEVEVHYQANSNAFKDRGRLSDFGDIWIELQKGGPTVGELLVIPTSAIRLLKIVHPPDSQTNRLLQPVYPGTDETVGSEPDVARG